MIKVIRKIFDYIYKIDNFISKEQRFDLKGGQIIALSMFLIGGIGALIQYKFEFDLGLNVAAFYFGGITYIIIIPYGIIKDAQIKKYFIFGEKEGIAVVIKRLELKSYSIFLIYLSWISLFPLIGIPMIFKIFNINILLNIVLKNLFTIVCFIVSLSSFLWFAYHIVILGQEPDKVKEKLALLTAIITTISTIIANIISSDLKIIISYILLSYVWIRYLIELKANNQEI